MMTSRARKRKTSENEGGFVETKAGNGVENALSTGRTELGREYAAGSQAREGASSDDRDKTFWRMLMMRKWEGYALNKGERRG